MFGGRPRITEYTCNTTRRALQWIVEPLVRKGENIIRFTVSGSPGETLQIGNIIGIKDSRFPLVSRLRIMSDPSLPTADVVCLTPLGELINDTRPYFMDTFSKLHCSSKWFEPTTL